MFGVSVRGLGIVDVASLRREFHTIGVKAKHASGVRFLHKLNNAQRSAVPVQSPYSDKSAQVESSVL